MNGRDNTHKALAELRTKYADLVKEHKAFVNWVDEELVKIKEAQSRFWPIVELAPENSARLLHLEFAGQSQARLLRGRPVPLCPKCKGPTRRKYTFSIGTHLDVSLVYERDETASYHNPNTWEDHYACLECGETFTNETGIEGTEG